MRLANLIAPVVAAILGFAACVPSDPGQTGELALRLSDGRVVARLLPCESQLGDTLRAIELVYAGKHAEDPLWEVDGTLSLSGPLDIGVGDAQVGALAGLSLQEPLSPETRYILVVSADRSPPMLNEFSISELDERLWLTWTGRRVRPAELTPYRCR